MRCSAAMARRAPPRSTRLSRGRSANAPKAPPLPPPAEIKAEAKAVDTTPTDGQKEAGNYQMGHIKVHGLDVTIETPKGAIRQRKASRTAPNGR